MPLTLNFISWTLWFLYHNIRCTHLYLRDRYLFNFTEFEWLQTLDDCRAVVSQQDESSFKGSIAPSVVEEINRFYNVVLTSMSDDIHTPVVLAALSDPLKIINDLLHTRKVLDIAVARFILIYSMFSR